MFTFSRLGQAGIAAVSYLAEVGDTTGERPAGSAEIAEARGLSRAVVAKVLTHLSAAGIVRGRPGPAGGYWLARPASQVSLLDIVRVFDDPCRMVMCPFGPQWCGSGPNCPLHDRFLAIQESVLSSLAGESFARFRKSPPSCERVPATSRPGTRSPGCSSARTAGRPAGRGTPAPKPPSPSKLSGRSGSRSRKGGRAPR